MSSKVDASPFYHRWRNTCTPGNYFEQILGFPELTVVILQSPPYSAEEPCSICLQNKVWDHSFVPDIPDTLCGSQHLILALEVLPGETFTSSGHTPLLAGIDGSGRKEFAAAVMYFDEVESASTNILFNALTTVTEGASSVCYLDDSSLHTTEHFWVFVLRYDTEADVEQKLLNAGMVDVTGHCYWKPDNQPFNFSMRLI